MVNKLTCCCKVTYS